MAQSLDESFHRIMDGSDRSIKAAVLRAAAGAVAPFYGAAMRTRNTAYDTGLLRGRSLGRPTVSVGNVTLGGTGKTPVVAWLAARMIAESKRPAVLMRGYKSDAEGRSDEQMVLKSLIGNLPVIANPDRVQAAAAAISEFPETALFILDDGMQHRRARRDFDLVLIHASRPFGHDRIFPRGLLREPLDGLRRASSLLITHCSEVPDAEIRKIETRIRQHTAVPIFRCDHVISDFLNSSGEVVSSQNLRQKPLYAFCGIGTPDSFGASLHAAGAEIVGVKRFADHHEYTLADLEDVNKSAARAGALGLITTEKDWAKIARLGAVESSNPIYRAQLKLRFRGDHEERLFTGILKTLFP